MLTGSKTVIRKRAKAPLTCFWWHMNALASRLVGLALSQHVSMLQQRTCFKTVFSALEFSAWPLAHWRSTEALDCTARRAYGARLSAHGPAAHVYHIWPNAHRARHLSSALCNVGEPIRRSFLLFANRSGRAPGMAGDSVLRARKSSRACSTSVVRSS